MLRLIHLDRSTNRLLGKGYLPKQNDYK
jgi:hypothetical protein